jgi:DNA-binding MarR family transcriptional regulator
MVNQNSVASPNDVFEEIHAIMHLYRSQQYRGLRGEPHELTHMENKVLDFFARQPGSTLTDLVAHSGRDKAQLTRLIRGLREKGLLEARVDEGDRRSTRLQLTAEAAAIHEEVRRHSTRLAGLALEGLSDAEQSQLAALLDKVRANLERQPG